MMTPSGGARKPPVALIIAAVLITALAVVTVVAGLTVLQLVDGVTEQSKDIDRLYQATLIISLIVFFGVTSGIIYAIFRFRRVDDRIPEQIHGSSKLEFTWTVIPVLILIGLFVPAFGLMVDLKTPPDDEEVDVVVEVIGHQWWWEFNFPEEGVDIQPIPPAYQLEGIALGDEAFSPPTIVLPVDQTILFKVISADVIHSFYPPGFLFKMHAVPGTVNEFAVNIDEIGVYAGQCAQFCGVRHSDMLFVLDVRSVEDYEAWLAEQVAGAEDGAE